MIVKKELWQAIAILKACDRCPELTDTLESILNNTNNPYSTVDLLDRNAFMATVLWTDEDIEGILRSEGIEPTDAIMHTVKCRVVDSLEDCSDGYEIITAAIHSLPLKEKNVYFT